MKSKKPNIIKIPRSNKLWKRAVMLASAEYGAGSQTVAAISARIPSLKR